MQFYTYFDTPITPLMLKIEFFGIHSLDSQLGLSENDREVVQIKKPMIKASKKTICIGISEKLNAQQKIKVANLDETAILITELDPNDSLLLPFRKRD